MTGTFAARLKVLRARKKMSQEELSEKLGIPRATIAGYEAGVRFLPREKRLKNISNFFGVSVDYLIGRTEVENETKDLEMQIIDLIQNASIHYDYKYIYSDAEKQKIIEILLNFAQMEPEERKLALEMLARMAKPDVR